jgi:hypothetical protein
MMGRESKEERVQRLALLGVERRQELLLEALDDRTELGLGFPAGGSELHKMATAVARITAPFDQPPLLELVENAHEVAAVVTERIGDRRLSLPRSLSE